MKSTGASEIFLCTFPPIVIWFIRYINIYLPIFYLLCWLKVSLYPSVFNIDGLEMILLYVNRYHPIYSGSESSKSTVNYCRPRNHGSSITFRKFQLDFDYFEYPVFYQKFYFVINRKSKSCNISYWWKILPKPWTWHHP